MNILKTHPRPFAIIITLLSIIITLLFLGVGYSTPFVIMPLLILGISIGTGGTVFLRDIRALRHRIVTKARVTWLISVNEVYVGEISDADYARLCLQPMLNHRIFLRQGMNILQALIALTNRFVLAAPVIIFWSAVLYGINDPQGLLATFHEISGNTPEALSSFMRMMIGFLFASGILSYLVYGAITGDLLGLRDEFNAAAMDAVRQHLGIIPEGRMTMISQDAAMPLPVQGCKSCL